MAPTARATTNVVAGLAVTIARTNLSQVGFEWMLMLGHGTVDLTPERSGGPRDGVAQGAGEVMLDGGRNQAGDLF